MNEYIAVYCGSSKGKNHVYAEQAKLLAKSICNHNFHLVYGAGHVGLMGIIADEILIQGHEVVGVIPHHLIEAEVAHQGCTELIPTDTMHERKSIMAERSVAFIAMAGGFGTLDEMLEVMTWSQLGLHKKPMAFFNVNGYFDKLLSFFDQMVEEGFLKQEQLDLIIVDDDPDNLLKKIISFESNYIPKWLQ